MIKLSFVRENIDKIQNGLAFLSNFHEQLLRTRFVKFNGDIDESTLNWSGKMNQDLIKHVIETKKYKKEASNNFDEWYKAKTQMQRINEMDEMDEMDDEKSQDSENSENGTSNDAYDTDLECEDDSKENDDNGNESLIQARITLNDATDEGCFAEYFIQCAMSYPPTKDVKNLNEKAIDYTTFLRNIFIQMGVFWNVIQEMEEYHESKQSEKVCDLIEKYNDLHILDLCFVNQRHQSLFHIAVAYDINTVFDRLIEMDNNVSKYKDIYGQVESQPKQHFSTA